MTDEQEIVWRVLLVDDDGDDYLLTRLMLHDVPERKVQLDWAPSYEAALEQLRSDSYDAVLVDYDLGPRTGIELIRELTTLRYSMPFILYTGRGSYEVDVEAMQAGATLYLTKAEVNPLLLERFLRYAIERYRIEQELDRRIQERLHILESIQDGFFSIDRNWVIQYANQRVLQSVGYKLEDLIGRNIWETFPRILGTPYEQNYRLAMNERKTMQFEMRGIYVDIWYNISVYPSAEGISVFWQDISERKRMEEEIRSKTLFPDENPNPVLRISAAGELLYANLPAKTLIRSLDGDDTTGLPKDLLVASSEALDTRSTKEIDLVCGDRAFSFVIAPINNHGYVNLYGQDITQRNQALQDFAFVASHDLREPIRKIQAFADRLEKQASDHLNEQEIDYLERMQQAAGRMQGMLDGLLAYSRVTTRGQSFEEVDLNRLVAQVLSDLDIRLKETGGNVDLGELPVIRADPFQLQQLIENLIGNGLKFNQPGIPPCVKVYSQRLKDDYVELIIEDNGIGFDMSHVGQLFQPFHRLVGRSEFEGSGMGLAICQKIVERHGGEISATGTPGGGSTFTVRLPCNFKS